MRSNWAILMFANNNWRMLRRWNRKCLNDSFREQDSFRVILVDHVTQTQLAGPVLTDTPKLAVDIKEEAVSRWNWNMNDFCTFDIYSFSILNKFLIPVVKVVDILLVCWSVPIVV